MFPQKSYFIMNERSRQEFRMNLLSWSSLVLGFSLCFTQAAGDTTRKYVTWGKTNVAKILLDCVLMFFILCNTGVSGEVSHDHRVNCKYLRTRGYKQGHKWTHCTSQPLVTDDYGAFIGGMVTNKGKLLLQHSCKVCRTLSHSFQPLHIFQSWACIRARLVWWRMHTGQFSCIGRMDGSMFSYSSRLEGQAFQFTAGSWFLCLSGS